MLTGFKFIFSVFFLLNTRGNIAEPNSKINRFLSYDKIICLRWLYCKSEDEKLVKGQFALFLYVRFR